MGDFETAPSGKNMSAEDVVSFYDLAEQNGIEVLVNGGWEIDVLVGEQTRAHGDLDIAVRHDNVPKLRELLAARGYGEFPRDDSRDCNFVLGDGRGHEVDVHSFTFDDQGNNIYGVPYLPEHLTGCGSINGKTVRCINSKSMMEFHSGYEVDEDDWHDVSALHKKFGLPIPDDYQKFEERDKA
jgi:lincosamide nucleotidyltransferase A/C/D/E